MALDTSIYNNIQAPQMPDAMGAATKAMTLSQLGMQNQQMQLQLQTQQAMRQAYQNNRNPDGSMNREGMLSDLGRVNPQAAMEMQQHFVAQDKAQAEAQKSQAEAAQSRLAVGLPVLQDLLTNVPQDQRAKVYPTYMKQLSDQGVDLSNVLPPQYDEGAVKHLYVTGLGQKQRIDNVLTQSATAKNVAEIGKIQAETGNVEKTRLTDYQKFAQGDDSIKKPQDQLALGKSLLTAIDDAGKNPSSAANVPIMIAKFTTAGSRMTDPEIQRNIEAGAFGDQLKQMLAKGKSGTMTQDMRDYAKQFATTQMKTQGQLLADARMDFAKKYANDSGLPVDVAHQRLFSSAPGALAQVPAGPARFAKKQGQPQGGSGSGLGLESDASAATPPPANSVKMTRDGKTKWIPKSMKGAAISDGWDMVK